MEIEIEGKLPIPPMNPESYLLRRNLEFSVETFGKKNPRLYKIKEPEKEKTIPKSFTFIPNEEEIKETSPS